MVRALFAGPPQMTEQDAQTLAFLGITGDHLKRDPEQIVVWPEHHTPLRLLNAMATQWRAGPMGLIGLDYGVVDSTADRSGISLDEVRECWSVFTAMEREALACMRGRADG